MGKHTLIQHDHESCARSLRFYWLHVRFRDAKFNSDCYAFHNSASPPRSANCGRLNVFWQKRGSKEGSKKSNEEDRQEGGEEGGEEDKCFDSSRWFWHIQQHSVCGQGHIQSAGQGQHFDVGFAESNQ